MEETYSGKQAESREEQEEEWRDRLEKTGVDLVQLGAVGNRCGLDVWN